MNGNAPKDFLLFGYLERTIINRSKLSIVLSHSHIANIYDQWSLCDLYKTRPFSLLIWHLVKSFCKLLKYTFLPFMSNSSMCKTYGICGRACLFVYSSVEFPIIISMHGKPGHNTQLHATMPPSFLGIHGCENDLTTKRSFYSQATWVIHMLGLSMDVCITNVSH